MRLKNYSVSALNAYRTCPLQFKLSYIDRERTPPSAEAFVGNVVHSTILDATREAEAGRPPNMLAALSRFGALWEAGWEKDNVIVFRDGGAEEVYRSIGEKCVAYYVKNHGEMLDGPTVVAEERLYLTLGTEGLPFVVVPDRVSRADPGAGEYVVHDYKTKAKPPTGRDLREDRQLPLYETAIRSKFGDARQVRLAWHYLQIGQTYEVTREKLRREEIVGSLIQDARAVEVAAEFPPNPSPLCHWCMYWEKCPAQGFRKREVVNHRPVAEGPANSGPPRTPAASAGA